MNTSNAGPFVNLHEIAKRAINPQFSDGSARQECVMPILDNLFKHAFAIMLNEIKDHLVNGLTNNWCLLQRNGLDDAVNGGVTPNPQSVLLEIAALLKVSKFHLRESLTVLSGPACNNSERRHPSVCNTPHYNETK